MRFLSDCLAAVTAVLERIVTTLRKQGGNGLVAAEARQAVLSRIHGSGLLPAPFVMAHLRIGIALQVVRTVPYLGPPGRLDLTPTGCGFGAVVTA